MSKSLRSLFTLLAIIGLGEISHAQVYSGAAADKLVKGASTLKVNESTGVIEFARFREGATLSPGSFIIWAKKALKLSANEELREIGVFNDAEGNHHRKYQQYYKGVPVFGAIYVAHIKNDRVVSVSGKIAKGLTGTSQASLSENAALTAALNKVNAEQYKWELPEEERFIKEETGDPSATFFPKGKLTCIIPSMNFDDIGFRLAYQFDIYAHKPLYRADVFVDALTGEILYVNNNIHDADVNGTAATGYNGTRTIVTDYTGSTYRLREASRGGGIQTFDMNTGTTYGNAVDFTDANNNWNNVNAQLDQYATDAHWGAEMTYDYYQSVFSRNSVDGNGLTIKSYIHYDNDYFNAFWDGSRATFGDGDGFPLTTLDVVAHELTHGVTGFSAALVYQDEPGALNESFSDIFGTAVEFYARPNDADWLMGEELGSALRSMSNPSAYGDPDTYLGNNWYTGTGDNGGVHINSGVQNKWFYILTQGETGTNDLGDPYNVTGIGIDDAAAIAYRNLTVYLSSSSDYEDARFYAIQSATDLFGACSPQVIATANAWYAVGVGDLFNPTVTSDFETVLTSSCQIPFAVQFTNLSNNGGSFTWDFGDGSTSNSANPTHTYTSFGDYTVSLVSDGGVCGSETEIKSSYISVDNNNPCITFLPPSGTGTTQTSCLGTLYDNGGANDDYTDNTDVRVTIAPTGASTVTLTFTEFNFEEDYDYLYVYDGATTNSPLIGQYTGNSLPNGGTVTSTGGYITVRQVTDPGVTALGFAAQWECTAINSAPSPNFTGNPIVNCSGEVNFTDLSVNGPTAWAWDFGDGNTSNQQNPTHTYQNEGSYTVTLTVSNGFGSTQSVRNNYVIVDKPDGPSAGNGLRCGPGTFDLSANGSGTLNWYDAATGGNLLHTGNSYTTSSLNNTTSYYVEEVTSQIQNVGPVDNTFGSGGYFVGDQYLIFDCFTQITLRSVKVYAEGAGGRTIELRNSSGVVLETLTTNIPNGESRVTLNWTVPTGNNYQLGTLVGSEPGLYRNSQGPSYPYSIPGGVTIETSSAGDGYYYFFYDWEVDAGSCISERTEVVAEIVSTPIGTDGNRCGEGTVDLNAAGGGSLVWYDVPSNGNQVGGGASFTTPSISSTTTYYVEAQVPGPSQYGGASDNSFGTGGYFTGEQSLLFDALGDFTLVSVKVYASGAGNRTFELRNGGGTVLESTTVNVPDGESRVTLNFNVATGTGYQLGVTANANLYRNNSGPSYPYTLSGVFSITNSTAGTDYYYTFYDWEVQQEGCATGRVPVTAYIEALPILNSMADQEICPGESVNLSASGTDINSYNWSPSGQTGSDVTVSPSSTTTYTVTGTNNCGSTTEDVEVMVYATSQPIITQVGLTLMSSTGASYQWYQNGSLIPGANDSIYELTEPGNYIVEVTDVNGCVSVSEVTNIITIDVVELNLANVKIYPNPSNDIFNVVLPGLNGRAEVLVYNSVGEIVYSVQTNDSLFMLDASTWANGLYSIQIIGDNFSVNKKLVKTR